MMVNIIISHHGSHQSNSNMICLHPDKHNFSNQRFHQNIPFLDHMNLLHSNILQCTVVLLLAQRNELKLLEESTERESIETFLSINRIKSSVFYILSRENGCIFLFFLHYKRIRSENLIFSLFIDSCMRFTVGY